MNILSMEDSSQIRNHVGLKFWNGSDTHQEDTKKVTNEVTISTSEDFLKEVFDYEVNLFSKKISSDIWVSQIAFL